MTWDFLYKINRSSIAYVNMNGKNLFKLVVDCNQLQSIKITFSHKVGLIYPKTKESYEKQASKKFVKLKDNPDIKNHDMVRLSIKLAEAKLKTQGSSLVCLTFNSNITGNEFDKLLIETNLYKEKPYDIERRDHSFKISGDIFNIIQQNPCSRLNLKCEQDINFAKELKQAEREYAEASEQNINFRNFFKKENFVFNDLKNEDVPGEYTITLSKTIDLERLISLLATYEDITDLQEAIFATFDFNRIKEFINSYDHEKIKTKISNKYRIFDFNKDKLTSELIKEELDNSSKECKTFS